MESLAEKSEQVAAAFPAPVPPAEEVLRARRQRLKELTRVTVAGVGVRAAVIVAELVGVAISGSATLFVDAVASIFDAISSLVLLAAMRFAARPPDADHPFGHGRAEPLAGFQLGLLLCGAGVWMGMENLWTVWRAPAHAALPGWLWLIPACATCMLLGTYWLLVRAAARAQSSAVRAEAAHFQVDAATSLLTAAALLAAALWPERSGMLDHLGGAALGLTVALLGGRAAWENLHQILDRVPREEDFARVRTSALQVDGVIDVEKVRIQRAGPDAHVDIDIEVRPEISVAESHVVAQQVRARIQTDWPFVREVVVHVEPFYAGDH
jgi:cation diffusion facilitator family transporter